MNAAMMGGIIFVIIGIACFLFPNQIYKHDQRMKRFIKSPNDYRIALFLFGLLFCFLGFSVFVFGITGIMQ